MPQAHKSDNVALSLPREKRAKARFKEHLGFAEISHLSRAWSHFGHPVTLKDLLRMFVKCLK